MLNETAELIEARIRERAEAPAVSAEELRTLAEAWHELHKNDFLANMPIFANPKDLPQSGEVALYAETEKTA